MKKWLKRIGIGLAVLIVLFLVVGFLLPDKWMAQRSREIAAGPTQIHAYVSDWTKWPEWSPFEEDGGKQIEFTIEGPSRGVGAKRSWKGGSMGDGSQTIVSSDPVKGFGFRLDAQVMAEPLVGTITYAPGSKEGTTLVTWTDQGKLSGGPIDGWMGLILEPMIGGMIEQGLENLDKVVTQKP